MFFFQKLCHIIINYAYNTVKVMQKKNLRFKMYIIVVLDEHELFKTQLIYV